MGYGCFITGTDTGVGKTVLTAALAVCCRRRGGATGVMKPIETGLLEAQPSDAERLRDAAAVADPVSLISPYRLPDPLAPLAAARRAGFSIDLGLIEETFKDLAGRYSCLLVEGIGGVRVPLTPEADVRDLIRRLGLPALVVGRAALGGVSQALLTLEALQARSVPVLALVLNRATASPGSTAERAQEDSTRDLLVELSGVRVLGPLPHVAEFGRSWEQGVASLATDPVVTALADLIGAGGRPGS